MRSRIVGMLAVFACLVFAREAPAQFVRASHVGQVNGTPAGAPGQRVEVHAGLSEPPQSSLGYWHALPGWVEVHYWTGTQWRYSSSAYASGVYGLPNAYSLARFNFTIPSNWRRGTYVRLRFIYRGVAGRYLGSQNQGNVYVR